MSVTDHLLGLQIPGFRAYTKRFDYDLNGNCIYMGWAQLGSATSEKKWTIIKFTVNGSNQTTGALMSTPDGAIWDNRATESYG